MTLPSPSKLQPIGTEHLDDTPTSQPNLTVGRVHRTGGVATTISKNVVVSFIRVGLSSLIALILPAFLTHRLPPSTYGAWVLILQMGAYVSFLDFGVQTGVAKFVAEYHAKGDEIGAGKRASTGFVLMVAAAVLGVLLTLTVVWQVPRLFRNMPNQLYPDVRTSLLLIGASLAFGLVCSVFSAIFIGLQKYEIPVIISVLNRILFTIAVCTTVSLHGSLITMGVAAASANVFTGLLQVAAWRLKANRIQVSPWIVDRKILKQVSGYCSVLAFWSVSMLCISGLDLTIVGHYDFGETAYYSLATLPANLIIMIISAALGPLMPAASALSTERTPQQMGEILCRTTRYTTILVLFSGLPLVALGYPLLRLWVGSTYALHSVKYLQILVLATIVRNLLLPYATIVVATGKQNIATAAGIAEAVVNLGSSIYLVRSIGAAGVAIGTLLGALVSILMHFFVSMHYTSATISISRGRLLLHGLLRPSIIAIPTALLAFNWGRVQTPYALSLIWASLTLAAGWFGGLSSEERYLLLSRVGYKLRFR